MISIVTVEYLIGIFILLFFSLLFHMTSLTFWAFLWEFVTDIQYKGWGNSTQTALTLEFVRHIPPVLKNEPLLTHRCLGENGKVNKTFRVIVNYFTLLLNTAQSPNVGFLPEIHWVESKSLSLVGVGFLRKLLLRGERRPFEAVRNKYNVLQKCNLI